MKWLIRLWRNLCATINGPRSPVGTGVTLGELSALYREAWESRHRNAKPLVDNSANQGPNSQCMTNREANDTGNVSDCPDETTQESSGFVHAGEASPETRTEDLRVVTLTALQHSYLQWLVLRHGDEYLGVSRALDSWQESPHQAGSDRTSHGGEDSYICAGCSEPDDGPRYCKWCVGES